MEGGLKELLFIISWVWSIDVQDQDAGLATSWKTSFSSLRMPASSCIFAQLFSCVLWKGSSSAPLLFLGSIPVILGTIVMTSLDLKGWFHKDSQSQTAATAYGFEKDIFQPTTASCVHSFCIFQQRGAHLVHRSPRTCLLPQTLPLLSLVPRYHRVSWILFYYSLIYLVSVIMTPFHP